MEKDTKNKVAIFLIALFLILPLVFANIQKNFASVGKYGTITIDDCSGIWNGLLCTVGFETKLAEYKLEKVSDSIIDSYAIGTTTIYEKRILFTGAEFKDTYGSLINLRDVKFYILTKEDYNYEVPVYRDVCKIDEKNGTNVCSKDISEYKTETRTREYWKLYNYEEMDAGTYTWKLEAKKIKTNQKVDFILKITNDIKTTEWAWFDSNWQKKQKIDIQEYSGRTTANYSQVLNITKDSDMNATYSDLRFVDSTETIEYSYWIDWYNASMAVVWVKLPTFTKNVNTTVYMYYDNKLVQTTSNFNTTFIYADDFQSDTSDRYIASRCGSAITMSSGKMVLVGGADYCYATPKPSYQLISSNYTLETNMSGLYYSGMLGNMVNESVGTGAAAACMHIDGAAEHRVCAWGGPLAGCENATEDGRLSGTVYYNVRGDFLGKALVNTSVREGNINNVTYATGTSRATTNPFGNYSLMASFGQTKYFEWFRVRPYIPIEPTYVFFAEEASDSIYPTFSTYWDNNATLKNSGLGLFNVTILNTNGTVFLEINNTNVTASNVSADVYNASYSFTLNGTYSYKWISFGNGSTNKQNISAIRSYFVNWSDATPPNVTFNFQQPADLSTTNFLTILTNISYNISDEIELNLSKIKLYFKTNDSYSNVMYYQNGTGYSGYFKSSYNSNASHKFLWQLQDNELLTGTYNYGQISMESISHSSAVLTGNNNFLLIELYNVSKNKQYGWFEIMANRTTGLQGLRFYYCNSSYNLTSVPFNNTNCNFFYELTNNTYNHKHTDNSSHMLAPFPINQSTNSSGNVKVTPTSYFIIRGATSTTWNYYYITNGTRTGAFRTSANNGNTWTNQTYTVDSHLHQFYDTTTFYYYACANDTTNNENCSAVRSDLIQLAGLPPSSPSVNSPTNATYTGNININYSVSISPNEYPILIYNISLTYDNETYIKTIYTNNSVNLSYIWNSVGTANGVYKIKVQACDNMSQCSSGFSENFTLYDANPVIATLADGYEWGKPVTSSYLAVSIPYSATDDNGISNVYYNITNASGTSLAGNKSAATSSFTINLNLTDYGTYYINLTVNDTGNHFVSLVRSFKLSISGSGNSLGGGGVPPLIDNFNNTVETNNTEYIPTANLFDNIYGAFTGNQQQLAVQIGIVIVILLILGVLLNFIKK